MLKSIIRNMLVFGTILILIVSGFLVDRKFNDEPEGTNIGLELPVYTINNQSSNNETLKFSIQNLKSPRGTRGAPGDWSTIGWFQLAPAESPFDGNQSFGYEIYDIFVNDSTWDLFLKIQLEGLNPPQQNATYDFYFNVSSSVWYRIRLYRRSFINWSFYVSYNYTSGIPDDNSDWTDEWSYFNIHTDVFNYNSSGFEYDNIDSVYFWVNKTKLSQGYSSLYYPNNFTLFADVHDHNRSQVGQSDRAPDSGCVWYEPWSLMIKDQITEQKWSTEGNTVGDEDVFGTLNEQDLRMITNGDQRMVITADGKVGIGTTSPSEKLDVLGNVHASGSFKTGTGTTYGDGSINLATSTNLNIDSGTLYVDNGNNRVGIGTTNPSTKLHVNGVITASGGTSTDWNTAYGWGDHALAGYLMGYTETDPVFSAWDKSTGISIAESQITNLDHFTNADETDPVYGVSPAAGITVTQISNWNTAYDWGNHTLAGYDTTDDSWTGTGDVYTISGNVGIGTTSPEVALDVHGRATIGSSINSATGACAIALGDCTKAIGIGSIAMGYKTVASGTNSTTMGRYTTAIGFGSTAMGNNTTASGDGSIAIGFRTIASGTNSTAMGHSIIAAGDNSFGIGLDNTARTITQDNTMAIMGGYVGIGTVNPDYNLTIGDGTSERLHFSGSINPENPPAGSVVIYFDGSDLLAKNSSGKVKNLAKF